jgi:SAM-dependent methyltransferase
MRVSDAAAMIAAGVEGRGPSTWADLGCGRGTFTLALAGLLPEGSRIHAMDTDALAIQAIPASHRGVGISKWHGDFLSADWPFTGLDGVLLANSLHYARDQEAAVRRIARHMRAPRFVIVEYDVVSPNPWVPHPLGRAAFRELFSRLGYSIEMLGFRRSVYHRADLYAALAEAQAASAGLQAEFADVQPHG